MSTQNTRRIIFAAGSGTQAIDLVGPMDAFAAASEFSVSCPYRIQIASLFGAQINCSSGMRIEADCDLRRIRGPIDTLIMVGGHEAIEASANSSLATQIARLAPQCRRVASVCSGAFVLAAAGLLEGRVATTHWRLCGELQRRFPNVNVEPNRIFASDSNIWTSAGVTAGIDLAMALMEADLGSKIVAQVARILVVFLRRPGGQSQFSSLLIGQETMNRTFGDLKVYIASELNSDLSVDKLAARVHLSPRQFARVFVAEFGVTPAKYVSMVRIDTAKCRLENTQDSLSKIAKDCGFSSTEAFSRSFNKAVGVSPSVFRNQFSHF